MAATINIILQVFSVLAFIALLYVGHKIINGSLNRNANNREKNRSQNLTGGLTQAKVNH